jgi:hypothetical protein
MHLLSLQLPTRNSDRAYLIDLIRDSADQSARQVNYRVRIN